MKKVVLVTGASSGIGRATAIKFAKCGYDVILHYFSGENRIREIEDEIKSAYEVDTLLVRADLSDEADIIDMVNEITLKYNKIDVLVNNAGIAIDSDLTQKNSASFKKILEVNLIAPFLVSKYISKYMVKGASIVNVGSTNGIDSYYSYSMEYDASKAGVHILTKDLAIELGPDIRVNAVAPGWIKTPMNKDLNQDFIEEELNKIVLNRFAEASEVANVIYFLASDEASYVNGSVIVVDGGRK